MDRKKRDELLKLPGVAELVEITYRRGYYQGAHWCVEGATEKQPLGELKQWLLALDSWRYNSIEKERAAVGRGEKRWRCPPEPWQFSQKKKEGSS
jgi:hypothetical protein